MNSRKTALSILSMLMLGIVAPVVAEDDAVSGETLYTERGCVYCHGPEGKDPVLTEYPKLAGQNEQYLLQQILDIKTTARKNGYTGMMQPAVVNITDEELAAIASYLAAL